MKRGDYDGMMGLAFAAALAGGCSRDGRCAAPDISEPIAIREAPAAQARVEEVRARFLLHAAPHYAARAATEAPTALPPALGASVASGFELSNGLVRAVISANEREGVARTASVALPVHASDPVRLEDDTSHVAVTFALRGAGNAAISVGHGIAMYPAALAGADVLHRLDADGTEDFVVFEERPAREELTYDVDVSRVAGLRLVSDTLEFVDEGGAPRLRVAPPYVVDASGARTGGALTVEGCAFDTSPRAPWGRTVTSPGASQCAVRVSWKAASYPAMLDPVWMATGSMNAKRAVHTATLLASGEVLVAGGAVGPSADLYDPTTGTFAVTGDMSTTRSGHTATLLDSGKVLLVRGESLTGYVSSAELYDPIAGTFALTGSSSVTGTGHTATLLGSGAVLVAGGSPGTRLAELYDPTAGTFAATGAMKDGRQFPTATMLVSGVVLVAGGDGMSGVLSSAELYDPVAASFATTGSMAVPRWQDTATMLSSGQVLVVGSSGATVAGDSWSAELYDPVAGTFSRTASMTQKRILGWTATLLGSGEVLVAGGDKSSGGTFSKAELFDPVGGTFAATASMTTARAGQTATMLASGKVLVAGGGDSPHGSKSSAELYGCITTCTAAQCGTVSDECGGTVVCGTCASGETCQSNTCVSGIVDAGTDAIAGGKDSGGAGKDSGGARDSGAATPGPTIIGGCSTAPPRNTPPGSLLVLAALCTMAMRWRRSRSPASRLSRSQK